MNAIGVFSRTTMRSGALSRRILRSGVHYDNTRGGNLPFKLGSRFSVGTKVFLFMGTGFAAPFLSAYWQFYKASQK